ncbi:hypothetical protein [Marinicella meishanensis]|uniref:hypothetical protein n=1 Tax=Marinicella meishanensis TaxID=2873263 RepID=UPI001CC02B17|nr:hypothetical protein [Marinicella sp. NBU2979]
MKHAIIFCVEKGFLEDQCRLLLQSYQQFAQDPNIDLIACSPRPDNRPTPEMAAELQAAGVIHMTQALNQDFLDYPIANKLLCCAHVEKHHPEYASYLFTDTDTVWLNPIGHLHAEPGLYLKPVGHKGPGTSGAQDPMDTYWQQVFALFDLPMPAVDVQTTIELIPIRGYYNAGYIWANQLDGFFQQWLADFKRLHQAGLVPPGFVSKDGNNFRCLDQVALAVTVARHDQHRKELPVPYNYHLPFRPMMPAQRRCALSELVHVHYHKWFQHPDFLDHVTVDEEKASAQYQWLKQRLPLQPITGGPFKC